MTESNQHEDVQEAVRDAVDSGSDIYQRVKDITLKALTARQLDMENITKVADAVAKGIGDAMGNQGEYSRDAFAQAVSALDDALAKAAEASKLAIQEAASKVSDYSQYDLNKATDDIQRLEELFLDTVKRIAKDSNQIVTDIVNDFTYARTTKRYGCRRAGLHRHGCAEGSAEDSVQARLYRARWRQLPH